MEAMNKHFPVTLLILGLLANVSLAYTTARRRQRAPLVTRASDGMDGWPRAPRQRLILAASLVSGQMRNNQA